MKIYWTLKSIPELEGVSKSTIRKIWIRAYWKTYYHWQQWIMSSTIIIYSIYVTSEHAQTNTFIALIGVLGIIILLMWFQVSIALARPYIKQYINKGGIHLTALIV